MPPSRRLAASCGRFKPDFFQTVLNLVSDMTNDVGSLTAPDGGSVAIAAFVAEVCALSAEWAAAIARAACAVVNAYRWE